MCPGGFFVTEKRIDNFLGGKYTDIEKSMEIRCFEILEIGGSVIGKK